MKSHSKGDYKEQPSKKKKREDVTYNPKRDPMQHKKPALSDGTNIVYMRSNNDHKFVDPLTGNVVLVKHCAVFDYDVITKNNYDAKQFKENLEPLLEKIPTFRPLAVVTEYSTTGTPIKGETPGKTQVRRIFRAGAAFSVLGNEPSVTPVANQEVVETLPNDHPFFKSPEYLRLEEALEDIKKQEVKVDTKLLAASKLAHDKAGKRRVCSQDRVAAKKDQPETNGRVAPYVKAAVVFTQDFKWEWLHLVAYKIWHAHAQRIGNIVAGSFGANTVMTMIESQISTLANRYKEGFKLIVTADMVTSEDGKKKTHIASTIQYRIVTKDFDLPLDLNAQDPNNPHQDYYAIIKALFTTLMNTIKAATPAALSLTTMPTFLFQRPIAITPPTPTPSPPATAKKMLKF